MAQLKIDGSTKGLPARPRCLGPVALLEEAAAGRAVHAAFLHHDLAARQGHRRIAVSSRGLLQLRQLQRLCAGAAAVAADG